MFGLKVFEPETFKLSKKTNELVAKDDRLEERCAETTRMFNEMFPDD